MNVPVSALNPVPEAPVEEAALDGLLRHLGEVIDVLELGHLDRLSGDGVLSVLSKTAALGRGIEAILTAASNDVAVRSDPVRGSAGLAARYNFARPSHLVEMVAGVSAATANRMIRVGSRTSPRASDAGLPLPPLFPEVGAALREGLIGAETADVITRELSLAAPRADVPRLQFAETQLVSQATGGGSEFGLPMPPDLVAIQARQWRDLLDEDGIEPRAEKAVRDRNFWVSRTAKNGLHQFGGQVTVDVAAKLLALFDAILSPRTHSRYQPDPVGESPGTDTDAECEAGGTGTGSETAGDSDESQSRAGQDRYAAPGRDRTDAAQAPREERTPGQIRADVFAAMIDSLARSTEAPTTSGAAPTVIVSVPAEVLEKKRGTGRIVGISDPVPYSMIKQILCDSSTIPAFLDPDGALVAIGTEKRKFNRMQRAGMIARDGPTCGIPGCQIPASACEAHHVDEYSNGGPTHTDNGALYCWFHHRMIDTGVFTVEMVDGKPKVTYPDWLLRKPFFR